MHTNLKNVSKFLSYILRHNPQKYDLVIDKQGWVSVDDILTASKRDGHPLTRETIEEVVVTNNKKRFSFSEDGTKIRANQGHSIKVDLGLEPSTPPKELYHGTAIKNLESIKVSGLKKMNRHHVHLSPDKETAKTVGGRHGKPIILTIHTEAMLADNHQFFISHNGVWLTDSVPVAYISGL